MEQRQADHDHSHSTSTGCDNAAEQKDNRNPESSCDVGVAPQPANANKNDAISCGNNGNADGSMALARALPQSNNYRHHRRRRLAGGCSSLMYACQQGHLGIVVRELRTKPNKVFERDRRNKSVLHYCTGQRDLVAAASVAVAAPELLESADEDGFTPLHLAVIQGNLAMVNLLLANKADVNAVDNEGHSVVHWATVCGEIEPLRAVLQAGASVATPDINGGSPLHYAAQMCGASYEGKLGQASSTKLALDILSILINHPQSSVDVVDKDGRQPLLWAASAGSAKAVLALVKAGARVESADKDGLTALHCAASRGHTECIDTLISLCGAATDLIDSNGCTSLHYAVTLGHADATSRLLDLEADPNRQDRKGRTPAHCGCSKGQFETVKLLKERGANLWLRNAKGDLPVHEAAASGRRELVEWLLAQRSKQVNTTSNDGRSLMHIAAGNDYTDMCKMLLDCGADINCIYRNPKGVVLTPLDCALQKGYRSTAKFLQSQGGLPATKLRLSARRPNAFNDQELVKSMKYIEKEEVHDLETSKKYVVYTKRSDSESAADCSCTESSKKKQRKNAHMCKHHRKKFRRRTSSCGATASGGKDDSCSDICRSKSNIEIRRRCVSRERSFSSEEDSCENCCRHKKKQRHKRRERSQKKSKECLNDSEREEAPARKEEAIQTESPKRRQPKESTFIKTPPETAAGPMDLTDEEEVAKSEQVVTQVDVHKEDSPPVSIEEPSVVVEDKAKEESPKKEGLVETKIVVEDTSKAEEVLRDEEKSQAVVEKAKEVDLKVNEDTKKEEVKEEAVKVDEKSETEKVVKIEEQPKPLDDSVKQPLNDSSSKESPSKESSTKESPPKEPPSTESPSKASPSKDPPSKEPPQETPPKIEEDLAKEEVKPVAEEKEKKVELTLVDLGEDLAAETVLPTTEVTAPTPLPTPQQPTREQETRRSFTLLPDTPDGSAGLRKSSFTVLNSDESVDVDDKTFQIVADGEKSSKCASDGGEYSSANDGEDGQPPSSFDYSNGRKRRLKKRVKSGPKQRSATAVWKHSSKDQDSGFEPSPRTVRTKIPSPRNVYTAYIPRKPIYATLDNRSCSSRTESRKLGDRSACDMSAVTRSIQRNIRRYYMERKIFQHLLELKSLQIRSSKLNESVLVKRAVDDYHKSCVALGSETGGKLRRFPYTEYTFKNFELFLYETLKTLQKPGTFNFQNINEVYEEAERRLSPDYNAYEKALQCTTKTHRCLHAAHAYTGIPCAAYIPMMNHHTMPKFGFGPYKKTGVGSFYLPKILTSQSKPGSKVSLELSHGKSKQLISLPSEKLDSNKRYYVTFTVKESASSAKSNSVDEQAKQPDADGK